MAARIVATSLLVAGAAVEPPSEGVIKFVRLWVSEDGETHLKHCHVQSLQRTGDFGTPQYVRNLEDVLVPNGTTFTQQTGENPWHPCPSQQFVMTLAGSWFINTTDGDHVELGPGDMLYQDDSKGLSVAGKAPVHYSGALGGPCNQLVISVDAAPVIYKADEEDEMCDWVKGLTVSESTVSV